MPSALRFLSGFALAAVTCSPAGAADAPVRLRAGPAAIDVKAGEAAVVRVQIEIAAPYHIYSTEQQVNTKGLGPPATEIALKSAHAIAIAGAVKTSPAERHYDPNFEMDLLTLAGNAWFDVPLKADGKLPPGSYAATLVVTYQACDDQNCLPPADASVPIRINVIPASAPATRR